MAPRSTMSGLPGPNGAGMSTRTDILASPVVEAARVVRIWELDIEKRSLRLTGSAPQTEAG
jgi:ABC-type multidrug transport system ATPase subunit